MKNTKPVFLSFTDEPSFKTVVTKDFQ